MNSGLSECKSLIICMCVYRYFFFIAETAAYPLGAIQSGVLRGVKVSSGQLSAVHHSDGDLWLQTLTHSFHPAYLLLTFPLLTHYHRAVQVT